MDEHRNPFGLDEALFLQEPGDWAGPPAAHPERLVPTQELFLPRQTSWPGPMDMEAGLEDELARILGTSAEPPAQQTEQTRQPDVPLPRPGSHDHRKRRRPHTRLRRQGWSWVRGVSISLAALTTVIVAMVSAFGAVVTYNPLRHLAQPIVPGHLAELWPLLVYGPWLVASLSVLRAALHHRGAAHSWFVVILFSAVALTLCVNHADKTLVGIAVAGLPPITALSCFHQLVRQITLTRPHRRPTRHRPAHRVR
ncbi:DUF2637 domain-containing protein [Streptomyces cremeus]|uniref:DUF2637 domain-containing protein n=1 Tax=Streptomyces cremeus TaxID=66881 RepID=A0ABV5P5Q6_STRCM